MFDRAPWKRTLEKYAPEDQLAQIKMPLYMVATDITTGHPTVYTNGEKPEQNKGLYARVPALEARAFVGQFQHPLRVCADRDRG